MCTEVAWRWYFTEKSLKYANLVITSLGLKDRKIGLRVIRGASVLNITVLQCPWSSPHSLSARLHGQVSSSLRSVRTVQWLFLPPSLLCVCVGVWGCGCGCVGVCSPKALGWLQSISCKLVGLHSSHKTVNFLFVFTFSVDWFYF